MSIQDELKEAIARQSAKAEAFDEAGVGTRAKECRDLADLMSRARDQIIVRSKP